MSTKPLAPRSSPRKFGHESLAVQLNLATVLMDIAERRGPPTGRAAHRKARAVYAHAVHDLLPALSPNESAELHDEFLELGERIDRFIDEHAAVSAADKTNREEEDTSGAVFIRPE